VAVAEVAVEPGLVDGADRPEPHRDRRELPELRHQAGVRVGGQPPAVAAHLHPEVVEVVLGEAPLEVGAGIDPRRGVALEVHLVAGGPVVLAPEEVVEPDLVQRGRRGERGEVPADALRHVVGARHHDGRVPPDERPDAALHVLVAREPRLELGRDRVDVGGGDGGGEPDALLAGALEQPHQQVAGAVAAMGVDHGVEGVQPLARLTRVDVRQLVAESVEHEAHASSVAPTPPSRDHRAP